MTYFTRPIGTAILTRNFYYWSTIYVGGQHAACDYIPRGRPATGEPIRAVAAGVVTGIGWDFYSGFFVAVDHTDSSNVYTWRSIYRHLFGQTPVTVDQNVSQGQIIGNVGNTGWSLGAHLHFDLWNRNRIRDDAGIFYKNGWYALDPELYLGKEDDMADVEARLEMLERAHGETRARLVVMEAENTQHRTWIDQHAKSIAALEGRSPGGGIQRGDTLSIKVL